MNTKQIDDLAERIDGWGAASPHRSRHDTLWALDYSDYRLLVAQVHETDPAWVAPVLKDDTRLASVTVLRKLGRLQIWHCGLTRLG